MTDISNAPGVTPVSSIVQGFKNLNDRIRKLEVKEQDVPVVLELFANVDTVLTSASDTDINGCAYTVDPGLYLVTGIFDFECYSLGDDDDGFLAEGKLYVNNAPQAGAAVYRLFRARASSLYNDRATVTQAWVVALWDYKQTVLADAPLFFLRLDDFNPFLNYVFSNSYLVDTSAYRGYGIVITLPITVRQPPATQFADLDGQPNYSFLFDGSTSRITITVGSAASFDNLSTASMEGWFKTTASGSVQVILSDENLATHRFGMSIYVDATGHLVGEIGGAAASQAITSPTTFNDGYWHHAVFTRDGSNLYLYADGIQVQTAAQTVVWAGAASSLSIGTDGTGIDFFNGNLDELAGYNVALSPDRVLEHHNRAIGQSTLANTMWLTQINVDLPLGLWRLGDSSGTTAVDYKALNNGVYSGKYALNQDGAIAVETDGTYNSAVQFEGAISAGKVTIGDIASLKPTAALSVELWVKPAAAQNANSNICGTYPAAVNAGWVIEQDGGTNNQYAFKAYVGGALRASAFFTLNTRVWSHLVCVFDSVTSTLKVYVNGSLVANTAIAAGTLTYDTSPILIGDAFQGGGRSFTGYIDEFTLYDHVLTQARVQAHYAAGKSPRATLVLTQQKTGGAGNSFYRALGTKMIIQRLFALARS